MRIPLCPLTSTWKGAFGPDFPWVLRRAHGGVAIDVRSNDVVFSVHASAATALTLVQICAYHRGNQRVSHWMWAVLAGAALAVGGYSAALGLKLPGLSSLGLLYLLSYLKLAGSFVKYLPQLALNRKLRSTAGFTVANALTDIAGGVLSIAQQVWHIYDYSITAPTLCVSSQCFSDACHLFELFGCTFCTKYLPNKYLPTHSWGSRCLTLLQCKTYRLFLATL